jgi:glycine/D-amino acid oxidase-like deaminating enzyme
MDLTSDHPFWLVKNGLTTSYPPLQNDIDCDVAVVGAGITGAIMSQRLSRLGKSVVVLDRMDVCTGSTSASTALLQYDIDVPLVDMIEMLGQNNAERAYQLSHESIDNLERLANEIGNTFDFHRKTSIYLADDKAAAIKLVNEARARKKIGLDVTYHDASSIKDAFGIEGVGALSTQQAASCDPYRFAHALLQNAIGHGARVFDRTQVTKFQRDGDHHLLLTDREATVRADTVVIATGYEASQMIGNKIVDLNNTYAIASQPLVYDPSEAIRGWNSDWMLWETKNPYLYLRFTGDNRLVAGGEDDCFHSPALRDACINAKAKIIERKVRKLIPNLDWELEFAWGGTFGKTADGLAYIGQHEKFPGLYFALGFGGNGITFSSIAASIISDLIQGKPNPDSNLFKFDR